MTSSKIYLKTATKAAKQAGVVFTKNFGCPKKVGIKNNNPRDPVTEVDLKIEKLIRKQIQKTFPKHKIIGEEFGRAELKKNDLIWIIDPIDGTTNFIQGLPYCCISIALWDRQGPLVGVVYNPTLKQMFTACRGRGAFLNGKKIRISKRTELGRSFGGYGWGRDARNASRDFPVVVNLLNKIRTLGSSTLEICAVASGVFDFHVQAEISVWDLAAGVLMVTEAGGTVTDWQGRAVDINTKKLFASNGKIHSKLLAQLKRLA